MATTIELPQNLAARFNIDAKHYLNGDSSRLLYTFCAINDYELGANLVAGQLKSLYSDPAVDFYSLADLITVGGATDRKGYSYSTKIVKEGVEIKHETVFIKDDEFYTPLEEKIDQARRRIQEERDYAQ